ncbi:hypothetical protein MBLNU459_g1329t1 [Dothideomycetes sp. NU459]
MGRFFPLYVRRSDGKLETVNTHKRKEANQPTPEQLDMKPDANGTSDYYREVPMDEPKHLDWRRKLGGMLARELGWATSEQGGYILVAFPEAYRLFEHVKTVGKSTSDGKPITKTKTHAGGGNDRQDAYLYGHPMGRKKRYRSPADYFPHLLWLVTDEAGDRDNCSCKICCPEEFDEKPTPVPAKDNNLVKEEEVRRSVAPPAVKSPSALAAASANAAPAAAAAAAAHVPPSSSKEPPVEATRQRNVQIGKPANSLPPAGTPLAAAAPITNAPRLANGLTDPRSMDQALDLRYGTFTFRQGEMVWFNRGTAWGLGVITRRWRMPSEQSPNYSVQPLSWPGHDSGPLTISKDDDLRPWLAWSVPGYTCQRLNQMQVTYDTADWRAIQRGDYGQGEIGVDGSILAAKAIDPTYTAFALISSSEPQVGVTELRWTGIYLGAEKVWVGDPVRLRSGPVSDVLVVREILERSQTSAFNGQKWTSLHLVGDVYSLKEVRYNNTRTPVVPNTTPATLPPRMLDDLRHRNPYTIGGSGTACYWKQERTSAVFELKDIRGRWYEASIIGPLLQVRQEYDNKARQGVIQEAGLMMNGRHDCNASNPVADARKPERRDALGKAVPDHVKIVDGSDPPTVQYTPQQQVQNQATVDPILRMDSAANGQTTRHQQAHHHHQGGVSEGGPGFEEFMNLDDLGGDPMPGLDQNFGAGQNYY